LDGSPMARAPVLWSTSSGGLTIATPPDTNATSTSTTTSSAARPASAATPAGAPSVKDSTNKGGSSIVVFKPNKIGLAKITAVVNSPGIPSKTLNFTVDATAPPPPPVREQPSLIQQFTAFPMILVPVGGAGGLIAVIVLVIRRGRGKGGGEDFDTSLE